MAATVVPLLTLAAIRTYLTRLCSADVAWKIFLTIGLEKQLFVDDLVIDKLDNVT